MKLFSYRFVSVVEVQSRNIRLISVACVYNTLPTNISSTAAGYYYYYYCVLVLLLVNFVLLLKHSYI